jgi:hypothetical protein
MWTLNPAGKVMLVQYPFQPLPKKKKIPPLLKKIAPLQKKSKNHQIIRKKSPKIQKPPFLHPKSHHSIPPFFPKNRQFHPPPPVPSLRIPSHPVIANPVFLIRNF